LLAPSRFRYGKSRCATRPGSLQGVWFESLVSL
jgi:hypothetical protein